MSVHIFNAAMAISVSYTHLDVYKRQLSWYFLATFISITLSRFNIPASTVSPAEIVFGLLSPVNAAVLKLADDVSIIPVSYTHLDVYKRQALNMLFAVRTIQERTGKDLGATFLSGTTISNSLTELYLLFKYLRPKELENQGINSFDAWAAIYAKKTTDYEFSVTNQIVQKERFRYFIKVPELANFYAEITEMCIRDRSSTWSI